MCRHVGYLGPPLRLAQLVSEPPHSLVEQAYAPLEMRGGGRINADGFGLGWISDRTGEVARYRRATPIWSDESLPALGRAIRSGAILAALRNATAGMAVAEAACAPFTDGSWLFSHNGAVAGWPESMAGVAAELPTIDLLRLDAPTDAALLWALVRRRLAAGRAPQEAVRSVVLDVEAVAPGSRLNLLLLGPHELVASTVVHSLSYRHDEGSVVVSSEPLDDRPGWIAVPDRQLVVASRDGVHLNPIEG